MYSPWLLAVGGTNLTLTPANAIESSGVWNDTEYPSPYEQTAAGGGCVSTFEKRPWWQPAIPGVSCCTAAPGFDLASGLGSPLANQIVQHMHH